MCGGGRLEIDESCYPKGVVELIEMCWAEKPAERPTMDAVTSRLKALADKFGATSRQSVAIIDTSSDAYDAEAPIVQTDLYDAEAPNVGKTSGLYDAEAPIVTNANGDNVYDDAHSESSSG